ncbi:hypothetical protein C0J45_1232 [Silurus meridionalis]|nr:hypothetical protein C0J45_1232 [Silurus meridionalis]
MPEPLNTPGGLMSKLHMKWDPNGTDDRRRTTHNIAAEFVSRLLTQEQKEHQTKVCGELCQCAVDEPSLMLRIITSDESNSLPSGRAHHLHDRKRARQVYSWTECMFIVFFHICGIEN